MYEDRPRRTDETDDEFNEWNRIHSQNETEKNNELSREQEKKVGERTIKATELTEKLDPFWDEHPELLAEAKEFGAPLEVGEFKKQGYSFGRGDNDEFHIMAPTAEYAEWLSKPSEEKGNFEGKIRENLEERRRADREKMLEEMFPNKSIDDAFRNLYGDRQITNPKFYRYVRERAWKKIRKQQQKVTTNYSNFAERTYRAACEQGFEKSSTDVSENDLIQSALRLLDSDEPVSGGSPKRSEVSKTAEAVVRSAQKSILGDKIVKNSKLKLTEDEKREAKKMAAERCIHRGIFMSEAIANNPEKADEVLRSLEIDKNQDDITLHALDGYDNTGKKNKQRFAEFFGLKDRIAEMIGKPEPDIVRKNGDLMRPVSWGAHYDESINGIRFKKIPEELTDIAMERISVATHDLAEQLKDAPEFKESLEVGRKEKVDAVVKKIAEWGRRRSSDFDFSQFLDTKKITVANTSAVQALLHTYIHTNPLTRMINKEEVLQALGDVSMEVEIDYKDLIRNNLLKRLESGMGSAPEYLEQREKSGYNYTRQDDCYLTKIFETESFKENQERLGIDFDDPAIMDLAFNGFLNTLSTVNGEGTHQADWYYENIFANDPTRFLSMVAAYRNSENAERGLKGKLTKFFNNNPQAFADRVKQEAERRLQEEINNEHRAIRTSILRTASRDDIKQLIEDRQKELLKEFKEKGAEQISTFTGQKTLRGEQEEREPKERKEAPFDFGIEKIKGLQKYADYIELNYPNSNLRRFIDTFPDETENNGGRIKLDSTRSYIGFSFEYDGKTCVIAESFGDPAGMYLYCGELGSDFKRMFDMSKFDAERDPNIAVVDHLDKDHFDEDLDTSYQKALMFFKSGDKGDVLYKNYKGQTGWRENQKREFPAWPIDINNESRSYLNDLAEYQAWQERQDNIQDRLRNAIERGGPEEMEREEERIANEDYDAA